jgi:hypothetical protein
MHSRNTVLLAILITLVVQTIAMFAFQNPVLDGHLHGSDSYMRLRRVLHLYEAGNWYDAFDLRTNAPYGELIHWTRLLDSILFAGAWLGSAVTEFPRALFVWGILVGPALLLVLVPIWSWGTRPFLSSGGFLLTFAIFPLLSLLNGTLRPGNLDHHGLIALLFLTLIAISVRLASGHAGPRAALAAGLVAGTAVWVGIIEVVAATYVGSALALLWLWRGQPYDRYLSAYVIGIVGAITLALIVERPPGEWLSPFYERLSFVHWFVFASAALTWFAVRAATRAVTIGDGYGSRFATLAVVGVISIVAIALVFPRFFQPPLVEASSPIIDQWLRGNVEFQSIWPVNRATTQVFLSSIGPAIIALGFMAWRWRTASPELRNVFAVLVLGYLFYLPLALNALRWTSFVQALTLLPLVMTIVAVWRWEGAFPFANQRVRLRSMAATVVIFGPRFVAAIVVGSASAPLEHTAQAQAGTAVLANQAQRIELCNIQAVSAYLNRVYESSRGDDILFTYLFWGSEIVWRTPYNVVGAPYTNLASLTDTSKLFQATSDADAAAVVRQRGIDLVLVCTGAFERYTRGGAANLHNRLVDKSPPPWLEPIELPAHLAPTFRLYRVNTEVLPR